MDPCHVAAGQSDMPSLKSLLQLKKKYDAPAVEELPVAYRQNTDKEKLYLWAAENYRRQIRQMFPHLEPLCLISKNECGVEKFAATFIKVRTSTRHLFQLAIPSV